VVAGIGVETVFPESSRRDHAAAQITDAANGA